MEGSEERYAIKDIIGLASEKDLGVENLKARVFVCVCVCTYVREWRG